MILQRSEVCPSCSVERVLLVARRRGVNTGEEKEKRAWGWGCRGLEGRLCSSPAHCVPGEERRRQRPRVNNQGKKTPFGPKPAAAVRCLEIAGSITKSCVASAQKLVSLSQKRQRILQDNQFVPGPIRHRCAGRVLANKGTSSPPLPKQYEISLWLG